MKNLLILDAGHDEYVSGKQSPCGTFKEWIFNNNAQHDIKKRAEEHGISVFLTNPHPEKKNEIGLTARANLANNHWVKCGKPKTITISLHANAYKKYFNNARGTETYVASNASQTSKNFAKDLNDEVVKTMKSIDEKVKDRGVKVADFTVIKKTWTPVCLVEYGFYTNKEDLSILKNHKDDLVEATVKSICKYFNIEYKAPVKEVEKPKIDENVFWRVVVGSNNDIEKSRKLVEELKSKGYKDTFIVKYTKQ